MKNPVDALVFSPIVLDLGRVSKNRISRLKQGKGKLIREINMAVEEVIAELGEEAHGRAVIPIVLFYRRRRKKNKSIVLP
jgi:hypothetical protein